MLVHLFRNCVSIYVYMCMGARTNSSPYLPTLCAWADTPAFLYDKYDNLITSDPPRTHLHTNVSILCVKGYGRSNNGSWTH